MAVFAPLSAAAMSVDLFPLWYQHSDEDGFHLQALWPLGEWHDEPGHALRALRPLVAWEENTEEGWRDLDVLWPVFHWRRDQIGTGRERRHLRLLPIVNWKRHESPDLAPWRLTVFPLLYTGRTGPEPHQRYTIVFPLWWEARDSRVFFPIFWSSPRGFRALFPLWGHFEDLWGRDEVDFVLWPLWARARRGEEVSRHLPWPFVGWTRNEGELTGLRLWPLVGWRTREDTTRGFALWPLIHFRRGTLPDGRPNNLTFVLPTRFKWEIGGSRLDVRWPLWGTHETSHRHTRIIAWPLYTRTVDSRDNFTDLRLLWFLFRRQVGETHSALEVMPIAGRRERPGRRLRYVLFPLFTHWERWSEDRSSDVRLALPLFVRSMRHDLTDDTWRRRTWVFPLFLRHERSDGTRETRWLFPLLITRSRGYERSWGALFDLGQGGVREDGTRWTRIFGRLYHREIDPDGTTRSAYDGLLINRSRDGTTRRLSLLGGVAVRTSDVDGAHWDWFNFSGESTD